MELLPSPMTILRYADEVALLEAQVRAAEKEAEVSE